MSDVVIFASGQPHWHETLQLWWIEFTWPVPNLGLDYSVLLTHPDKDLLKITPLMVRADGTFDIMAPENASFDPSYMDHYKQLKPEETLQ